jgi:tRNA modification GTPase
MNGTQVSDDAASNAKASRAALLTPPGRGAVAVVAAEGEAALDAIDASFAAANGRAIRRQQSDRILFGHWDSSDGHREEVVVLREGEDAIEVHCHGGLAAAERILAAFAAAGCEIESWQQRLVRHAPSKLHAEADVALASATTQRAAAILLAQRQGALDDALHAVRKDIAACSLTAAQAKLAELRARASLGLHLTSPWHVAIAGRPNVGKSSLINALVGYQRAIVFDEPGTTRDVLTAETAIDGWPVRLADAAGIRETVDPLEAEGVQLARRQLVQADLVLWVLDATEVTGDARQLAADQWLEAVGAPLDAARTIVVVNKIDLRPAAKMQAGPSCRCASALTGEGLPELLAAIGHALVSSATAEEGVPFTSRQVELLDRCRDSLAADDVGAALAALAAISR